MNMVHNTNTIVTIGNTAENNKKKEIIFDFNDRCQIENQNSVSKDLITLSFLIIENE